jgi:general secretion pathway protein J
MVLSQSRRQSGFTLIELLVAIGLMALMTAMSWRGIDGMVRAQTQMRERADQVLTLQAGLAQWSADLDALAQQPFTSNLAWDGRSLRLLRRGTASAAEGLHVVAWSRRLVDGAGQWLRWQSAPLHTREELQQAWLQAAQWAQSPTAQDSKREVRIVPLDDWKVFYYRGGAWSNPLSSAAAQGDAKTPGANLVDALETPDGVRLVLSLSPGQALSGVIQRDWVRPGLAGSP